MRYNVAQLLKEPIGSTRSYQIEETFTGPGRVAETARGPVCLLRTHQGVMVQADLEVQVTSTCGRCLKDFPSSSVVTMEVEFFPTVDVNTGRRVDLPEDAEEDGRIDENHNLDLSDMLRQYIIADQPMKPLCRPDCRGLCQVCGVNRNEEECQCAERSDGSSRGAWAQLLHSRQG